MAKTQIEIEPGIFKDIKEAQAKIGALPLSARKGQEVEISAERIKALVQNRNVGAIKGLLNAGGGQIHSRYICTVEASSEKALTIPYRKDGVDKTLRVPTWEVADNADILELVELGSMAIKSEEDSK